MRGESGWQGAYQALTLYNRNTEPFLLKIAIYQFPSSIGSYEMIEGTMIHAPRAHEGPG